MTLIRLERNEVPGATSYSSSLAHHLTLCQLEISNPFQLPTTFKMMAGFHFKTVILSGETAGAPLLRTSKACALQIGSFWSPEALLPGAGEACV
jgi:hypothetical protein